MGKATSTPELEKVKLLSHEEIVKRIEFLNKQKGIRYQQIAQDAENIAYYYFLQMVSATKFSKKIFQEKSQLKMCKYFKRPEIKAMLKDFS